MRDSTKSLEDTWVAGAVLSTDPLVTVGKYEGVFPMGLASVFPERFEREPSLHFIGLPWTAEPPGVAASIARDVVAWRERLPLARYVLMANTEYEAALLSEAGVPNIVANNAIFLDERIYAPSSSPTAGPRPYDAAYVARLDPFKRHELAAAIPNLVLMYSMPPGEDFERVKRILPHAHFANHERHGGQYGVLSQTAVCEILNRSRVGLCLSALEGAMRAAIEYALCGLAVVSTESIGGRERFLFGPHVRMVEDNPDAVARAVAELKAKAFNPIAIREHTGRLIAFDRYNFLQSANRIAARELGRHDLFRSFAPFTNGSVRWRQAREVAAGFDR
jgi:glycosyltransferase involved in cell wall biosynthesis